MIPRGRSVPTRSAHMSATHDSTSANPEQLIADLQRQLAEYKAERDEALQRETATAEVLQVINASPGDLTPVFDKMLERATSLCDAAFGVLWIVDASQVRAAASHAVPAAYRDFLASESSSPGPNSGVAQTIRAKSVLHFSDAASGEAYRSGDPFAVAAVELGGVRTLLNAPLVKDGNVLGILAIYRKEVRPFSDKQIALLENFAAQALIAMENARLLTETREALEQQTATAEVLGVINSSPGDLEPVFDASLEKAHTLCGATLGSLRVFEGEYARSVAQRGHSAEFADELQQLLPLSDVPITKSLVDGAPFVHIFDMAELDHPMARRSERSGVRTLLAIPLCKDKELLGAIFAGRQEVCPFTDKQIALLQNFAAQAVVAMENAPLLTETREALEQQTATAEVLQVINSSPGDLAPVFNAMLDKALGLCGAAFGCLWTYDGERMHAVALRGAPPDFAEFLTRAPHPVGSDNAHGRLLRGEPVVHIADIADDAAHPTSDPVRRNLIELGGGRTLLAVALRKDD